MAKRTEGKEFIAQILETVRNSKGGVHRAVLERLGRENGWAVKSVEQLLRTLTNTGSLSVRMAVYYSPDRLKAIEDRLGQTYIDIARVAEPSIPVIIPVKPVVPVVEDVMVPCDVCGKEIPSAPIMTARVLAVHKNRAHAPKARPPTSVPPEEECFFDRDGKLRVDWESRIPEGFRRRTCRKCGVRQDRVRFEVGVRRKDKRARGSRPPGIGHRWAWETMVQRGSGCGHGNHDWEYDPPFHSIPAKGPNGPGSRHRAPESASNPNLDADHPVLEDGNDDAAKPRRPASTRLG